MAKDIKKETPLMKQYRDIKSKYPNTILLFRVGDFYETFGEDAILASKVLGIVLTKRGAGSTSETELAGFPHHSIENYLPNELAHLFFFDGEQIKDLAEGENASEILKKASSPYCNCFLS